MPFGGDTLQPKLRLQNYIMLIMHIMLVALQSFGLGATGVGLAGSAFSLARLALNIPALLMATGTASHPSHNNAGGAGNLERCRALPHCAG